jgi:16S rRNA (adenine1518-N6/adenine1519-N6)-dimethyltransferase
LNYDSPAEIRAALAELGVALKKRWGQNFLVNRAARERILGLLDAGPTEAVWEIGPGLGCLTASLAGRCRLLLAFEIDHGLVRYLSRAFGGQEGFRLEAGDALETWPSALQRYGLPDKVVGNLPYSSASALIASFAEAGFAPGRMVFTVQRVLCQHVYAVRERFALRPGAFYPAPEVTSSVIELSPRGEADPPALRALFNELVRALFRSRRKTLWNNLLAWPGARRFGADRLRAALGAQGIDPGGRSEELGAEQLAGLARRLASEDF